MTGVTVAGALEGAREALLYDPQTSGGLLLCVPAAAREARLHELPHAAVVGRVLSRGETPLAVRA